MKIAIEGCAHGELEKIYDTIAFIEKKENYKVDLLLCCGDFQATRNADDLQCMAVPKQFAHICSFYKYYSGEKVAPILTIFIGGNHEASNYLQELPYGGWVAPNIYYLGYAGCVTVNGIRIAGISGIYKGFDYLKGHFEFPPYNEDAKRSVYHVRQLDVFRLKQLSKRIDICMSHDWPRGVHKFGNTNQLLRFKPYFKEDIENNKLGSPPCYDLLMHLKPHYWFSAHLHCQFSAVIPHENNNHDTKFLALDKCLPKRRFLQIIDVESKDNDIKLSYDLEWMTVLHLTQHLLSVKNAPNYMPGPNGPYRWTFTPTDSEMAYVLKKFDNNLVVPLNFCRTVEPYNATNKKPFAKQQKAQVNPQTTLICDILGIDDPVSIAMIVNGHELNHSTYIDSSLCNDTLTGASDSSFNTSTEVTPMKRKSFFDSLPLPQGNSSSCNINPDELDIEDDFRTPLDEQLNCSQISAINDKSEIVQSPVSSIRYTMDKSDLIVDEPTVPTKKKFKRRNESIYGAIDDGI